MLAGEADGALFALVEAEERMNRTILVPLDGSKETEAILPQVKRIASPRDHVHFIHVVPPVGLPPTQALQLLEQSLFYLQGTRSRWLPDQPGLDLVRTGEPAQEILGVALEKNINMIAMSTHGRSPLGRLLLGSVASEVVRKAQLPVLLFRPDAPQSSRAIQRILVAVEGTEAPQELLHTVKSIAGESKAEIVLFHAVPPVMDPAPQWAIQSSLSVRSSPGHRLQELADTLEKEGYVAWPMVSEGNPAEQILAQSKKLDVDLIALATHARTGLERLLEGSVAEEILRRSGVAVLLQKPLTARTPLVQEERHA
jgi:nucleotide-binding universal stress UspA family protein